MGTNTASSLLEQHAEVESSLKRHCTEQDAEHAEPPRNRDEIADKVDEEETSNLVEAKAIESETAEVTSCSKDGVDEEPMALTEDSEPACKRQKCEHETEVDQNVRSRQDG